jgi:hypothetical protein
LDFKQLALESAARLALRVVSELCTLTTSFGLGEELCKFATLSYTNLLHLCRGIGMTDLDISGVHSMDDSLAKSPARQFSRKNTEDACPRCGSPMVMRSGSRGNFLGCSRFPECRGTRDLPEGFDD